MQPYAYIVQVRDSDGITVSISWVEGELLPNEQAVISQTWIPEVGGSYTLELFVWDGLDDPEILGPMYMLAVQVV